VRHSPYTVVDGAVINVTTHSILIKCKYLQQHASKN